MMSIFLRSLVFNILFYLLLVFWVLVGMPTFLMPRRALMNIAKYWGRTSIWLLRVVCNIKVEYPRPREYPERAADRRLQASVDVGDLRADAVLRYAAYILKRELIWIPFFGWYLVRPT